VVNSGLSDFTIDHHHHHQHTMLKDQKKNTKIGCIQICKVLKKGRKLDESLMKAPAKDVDISKPFTD